MRYGLEQDTECGFGFHLFPLHVQLQSNVTRTAEVCMLSLSCSFASFEVHLLVCAVDFVNIFVYQNSLLKEPSKLCLDPENTMMLLHCTQNSLILIH